ncbi:MAG TPA: hypothetical protein VMZ53_05985 [Kofleriaceae bacterium]|nr:hypothetical protein [Kofleriaceae bacterium]
MRGAAAVMLVAMCVSRGDADPADDAVAEAQRKAAANDFPGAAAKYREAFAAAPRPDLLCNVGVAYYKARDLPRAQRYLAHCLEIGTSLDRPFIDSVKKVLDAVNDMLTRGDYTPVDVLVQPTTASFTANAVYDEAFVGSRRVWFPFGEYKLTVHAEGHVDTIVEVNAETRTPVAARVTLERAPVVEKPPAGSGSGSAIASEGSPVEAPPPAILINPIRKNRVVPIVVTTASFVAVGAALACYSLAKAKALTAPDAQSMEEWQDIADGVHLRENIAWGFAGLAVAGAAVSGYLWYRVTRTETSHLEVTSNGDGATFVLTGRW